MKRVLYSISLLVASFCFAAQSEASKAEKTHSASDPKHSPSGAVTEVGSKKQFGEEIKGDLPVVVEFYASWCGPCKRISKMLDSYAETLSGKVKFLKVNVDNLHEISSSYDVRAMPTVLLFDTTGQVVDRKVGSDEIAHLLNELKKSHQ